MMMMMMMTYISQHYRYFLLYFWSEIVSLLRLSAYQFGPVYVPDITKGCENLQEAVAIRKRVTDFTLCRSSKSVTVSSSDSGI